MGHPSHSVFSIGYDSLEAAFENRLPVAILAVLLVFKLVAVVINYASGGSGGLFSPALFFGGMLGGLIGVGLADLHHLGDWIPAFPSTDGKVIGGCVLLGMGAMFAAVVRCPITSLIIIFEMTGNYSLILPLMAGNIIAWTIARHLQPVGIYNALLMQDGINLRRLPAYRGARDYGKLPVQAIMSHEVTGLRGSETVKEALQRLIAEQSEYRAFPVLDDDGRLTGTISRDRLLHADATSTVSELGTPCTGFHVHPDSPIRDAANHMLRHDLRQVPVVHALDPGRLVGWLTLNDIARQQNALEE